MIVLDDNIRTRLTSAIDNGNVVSAAYVDRAGKPHVSFYGSVHVHSDNQLALWVRKADSELLLTMPNNNHIALLFGDVTERFYATFEGRCRVASDAPTRQQVYDGMHPIERKFDAEANGIAVVIDLDEVTTLSSAGKVVQSA